MKSSLPDADMQGVPAALMRAALRAREIAHQTNTAIVYRKDGVLVEEKVSADDVRRFREEIASYITTGYKESG